jgi:site-specific recombinase XerD
MTKSSKGEFFVRIRDFIKVYLPKQRKLSENTIRSYRKALEQLLDFIIIREHIPLSDISAEYITAENVNAYLSELENNIRRKEVPDKSENRSFYRFLCRTP